MKNYFKKAALVAAGLCVAAPGFAHKQAGGHNCHLSGFQLGVYGGYMSQDTDLEEHMTRGQLVHKKSNVAGNGGLGGVSFTYGYRMPNKFYIGLTLHGDITSLKGEVRNVAANTSDGRTEIKNKDNLGAYVRLGYLFRGVLPYVKLGYLNSKWESKSTDNMLGFGSGKTSKRLSGFQGGLGIEIPLDRNMLIAADYTYATFEKVNYIGSLVDGTAISKNNYTPQTNTFMVHLKYRFSK